MWAHKRFTMFQLNAWFEPFVASSANLERRLNLGTDFTFSAGGTS